MLSLKSRSEADNKLPEQVASHSRKQIAAREGWKRVSCQGR